MVQSGVTRRLLIDLTDLREFDSNLANSIFKSPHIFIPKLEEFITTTIQESYPEYAKRQRFFHVGFTGPFGDHHMTPRQLGARFLNSLISVEGMVTRCMLFFPHSRFRFNRPAQTCQVSFIF